MQGILSDIDVLVQIALGAEFHLNRNQEYILKGSFSSFTSDTITNMSTTHLQNQDASKNKLN